MVSEGSWKDYCLSIANGQVGFSVFKNAAENAMYIICKNFKPNNKNLKYLHLPGFYETFEDKKNYYKEQYPDLVGNVHFFNNIPFMTHMKGGTGLKRYDIINRGR